MSIPQNDDDLEAIIDAYLAQWNEPDPEHRSQLIRQVWAIDAVHVLVNATREVRETAARFAIPFPPLVAQGHDALDARVGRAYEMYVAPGQYRFEREGEPVRQAGAAVSFTWVMRDRTDGGVAGTGFDVLTFAADGRIRSDHQFVA